VNFSMGSSLSGRSTGSESHNDKMRRAIERNRAKQEKKTGRTLELNKAGSISAGGLGRKLPGSAPTSVGASSSGRFSSSARTSVGTFGDTKFSTDFRSGQRKAPASVGYATSTAVKRPRKTRRVNGQKGNLLKYLVYAGWIFCVILFFRLLFADRGVYEYFQKEDYLQGKITNMEMIGQENLELKDEIQKIKTNKKFQKKLVRDHLGFIAKDEYLILIPKER